MAQPSGSKIIVDWFGLKTDIVDTSDWPVDQPSCWIINKRDAVSRQKRANIVHAILFTRSTHHLRTILGTDWDVDEVLNMPDHARTCHGIPKLYTKDVERTALQQAARQGWTEGLRMLFDAGAKSSTSKAFESPLTLALQNQHCPYDTVELLLQHGADPNDHDNFLANMPLFQSVYGLLYNPENYIRIAELLMTHGADPNAPSSSRSMIHSCPLHAAIKLFSQFMHKMNDSRDFTNAEQRLDAFTKANVALIQKLVDFGADVNWYKGNIPPLIHKFAGQHFHRDILALPRCLYLSEHLDLAFRHGGNVNMVAREYNTALEYAVDAVRGHSNSVRWLIRHGADTTMLQLGRVSGCVFPGPLARHHQPYQGVETALILLQAGMRVSEATHICLMNVQEAIIHDTSEEGLKQAEATWHQAAKVELLENKYKTRKSNFTEYFTQQMDDLQEFSDVSLNNYPEEVVRNAGNYRQYAIDQIPTILEFLGQTQSLQWHCRRLVRENLVSLQPSVVKKLNIPGGLKRYILCHEV